MGIKRKNICNRSKMLFNRFRALCKIWHRRVAFFILSPLNICWGGDAGGNCVGQSNEKIWYCGKSRRMLKSCASAVR